LEGNPIVSIAARYIDKIPPPQMDFPDHSSATHALQMAIAHNVQGAIILLTPRCDPFQWDIPVLISRFKEHGIPIMTLDLNSIQSSSAAKNRAEAFIEMLNAEVIGL
jgi:benzoyl-CoA reductase/2-hydroxyglutaryl-CoA dehydratase subunit BcrC/BadD/HgdB